MNQAAEKHLDRAETYIEKGNGFYHKAAEEIIAAQNADNTLSLRQIGARFKRSATWAGDIVRWHTSGAPDDTLWRRGSHATKAEIETGAKKLLAEAPMETVEKMVAALPQERRAKIERAIVDTHPALTSKPPIGVNDAVQAYDQSRSFVVLMGGPMAQLSQAANRVRDQWDNHAETATDEQKEIVQQQINDAVATLLAINSDPQELLT